MSYDLILGTTKKNWARGARSSPLALPPAEPTIECTDKEKTGLERLAAIQLAAESGDLSAKAKWTKIANSFKSLQAKASAGNPKAKRSFTILKQAGFLQDTHKFNFSSGWSWPWSSSSSYDDGWKHAKEYGKAVTSKDGKTASQALAWMHDNKWTEVTSKGISPFYSSVTWSNPSSKDKIRLTFPGRDYQIDRISGSFCLSGEGVSFEDAWGQMKRYGSSVEKKDTKSSRDAIEWMILRGWKASNSTGTFPFYSKIVWSHASLPGKKIAFNSTDSAYALSTIVGGEVGPRKPWTDSEPVPQGARKAWADDEPAPKLPARKSWIDDEIPTLTRRAKAGDVSAQIALRKIALHKAADDEELSLDSSVGWPSPLMMYGDGMGNEPSFIGDAIPHDTYRAAVMLTAIKNAGGRNPTTKDFFAAKSKIDNKLGNMGVSIYLPGARPARKTY